ncbi:MAG TPA: hypothetical protein VLW17_07510 [Thermoanaerobaculaceae bacterium]|nr:hypothetical protein [Thermoanaerobaculaceae bacterium]
MAETPRVALLVPNLFLRIPLESAINNAGAQPVAVLDTAQALAGGFAAVVIDLGAAGGDVPAAIAALVRAGAGVLAFAPHVETERLAAARRAGAVALARSAFLARLPELLALVLKPSGDEGVRR